jgi:hypothetical protein
MSKGYIRRWEERKAPQIVAGELPVTTDYWFTPDPANAVHWPSKEDADFNCTLFNRLKIEIPSSAGGTHICGDFKSEERAPGEFVIVCEAPFIPGKDLPPSED